MDAESILLWTVGVHVVGFWVFLVAYIRARKQVRCVHYCFVYMSDWAIKNLEDEKDLCIYWHGRENTSFGLLDAEKNWKIALAHCNREMKRAHVSVRSDNHINYLLEGL